MRPNEVPVPTKDDSIALVTPPATVVDLNIFLHASPVYKEPLHVKRLASWLQQQCNHFTHIDCAGDPLRKLQHLGTIHAAPNSKSPVSRNYYSCCIDENTFKERLLALDRPTQIWVTSLFAYDRNRLHETISIIKQTHPGVPVVVGGAHASICPNDCYAMGADIVYSGLYLPAEETEPTVIKNTGLIVAARGCPNCCSYCAFSKIEGNQPKIPDVSHIIEQAEHLASANVTTIAYYAPAIFKNKFCETDEAIMKGLAGVDCDMVGWAGFEPKSLTARRAKLLRDAGFVDLTVPIQTLNRDIAQKWRRRDKLSDHDLAIENLLAAGFSPLEIGCDILMGSPDQTLEEIVQSMCWVWSKGLTPTIFPYTWVPGSIDAKRLGFRLEDIQPEQYQPYLFPFADRRYDGQDYIELVKLSRVLPQNLETALSYVNPESIVHQMIGQYLDEYHFDITQWEIEIALPPMQQGYDPFLSHPWELALLYLHNNILPPQWLISACGTVRTREVKYNSIRQMIGS